MGTGKHVTDIDPALAVDKKGQDNAKWVKTWAGRVVHEEEDLLHPIFLCVGCVGSLMNNLQLAGKRWGAVSFRLLVVVVEGMKAGSW